MKTFLLLISLFTLPFTLYPFPPVRAENMESDSYKLKDTNLNMTSGEKSSENFKISDTLGQTGAGKYSSSGFIVRAGFQYVYSIVPFTFSISKTSINFQNLAPQTSVSDSAILTVSSGGSHGYLVTVTADHDLEKNKQVHISQTRCDNLKKLCTYTTAGQWNLPFSYGFGYNMSGDDIPTTFIDKTYFRPFPTEKEGNQPAVIMSSPKTGRNKEAIISFKLNVSLEQETGQYQNTLKFVATPSY